jgi:hypothetical protein
MRAPLLEVPSARQDGIVIRQNLLASHGDVAVIVRLGDLVMLRERATRLE